MINLVMGVLPISHGVSLVARQLYMLAGTGRCTECRHQLGQIEGLGTSSSTGAALSCAGGIPAVGARPACAFLKARKVLANYSKLRQLFDDNMLVIGAGSAGLVASLIAATVRAKVSLVERHKMGGDCLNTGCVPSKALIRSGRIAEYLRRAEEFGLVRWTRGWTLARLWSVCSR